MTKNLEFSGSTEIAEILASMNEEGAFLISVLTDLAGFPIAWAAVSEQDPDMQSAVVALIQKTARQVRDQLGMAQMDEISVFDAKGQRLVCRPFNANGHELILAVLIPQRDQTYRRLTNRSVRAIQIGWKL